MVPPVPNFRRASSFAAALAIGTALLPLLPLQGCSWVGGVVSQVAGNFREPAKPEDVRPFPASGAAPLGVQWVGHSTLLLRMADRVFITDPLLGGSVGGVKARLVEPGIILDSLARLDAILISHSHADHLDPASLGTLESRFPGADLVFPEGVEEYLPRFAFPMHKMRRAGADSGAFAGETIEIRGVRITTVRSLHWGGRYGFDGSIWDEPGFTGYILEYAGMTVYYPGDTGYDSTLFRAIGERWSIDLAILPIAPCYDAQSVGTAHHVAPLGALKILEDTRARAMVPVHYGTIHEAMDPADPLEALLARLGERPALAERVFILKIGGQAEFFR